MPSKLIIGATEKLRENKAWDLAGRQENSPDLKIIQAEEKKSIGIGKIRELKKFLAKKPYQEEKNVALILEAQKLTEQAQNALLKTLEEPPGESKLVLTADHPTNLLPTVISRCEIVKLNGSQDRRKKSKFYSTQLSTFPKLLRESLGEKLAWVEKNKKIFKDRQKTQALLDAWEKYIHETLVKDKKVSGVEIAHQLSRVKKTLKETNAHPQIQVENFLLNA